MSINRSNSALFTAADETIAMMERLRGMHTEISAVASALATALKSGHKILFCGNGGSAAECQHLATEFVVRLSSERERPALPAIALTTDTSLLTACSNDYGFERVFARQVEALLQKGDALILLSTSGKSPNLLEAAKIAKQKGGIIVGLLGEQTTPLDKLTDIALHIPASSSQRVQEGHLFCGHFIVEMVEDLLAETGKRK
jgi:D-sedoheptulose 7-phosphate isomerase